MIKTRKFPECNYKAIWFNGKTIRLGKDIKELDYPEFYDVKITDYCAGKCIGCYMSSTENGKHFENIVGKVKKFFGEMSVNQRPFQVACLEENELVFTKKGPVPIKDLSEGDTIFDRYGKDIKIVNVVKSKKESFKIVGNKGFETIASENHQFLTSKGLKTLEELEVGDILETADFSKRKTITTLDLKKYEYPNSKRDSVNTVQVSQNNKPIARYLKLTDDIMWLYGLIIAEGDKRAVSLNITEDDYVEKAKRIYEEITFVGNTNLIRKSNSQALYFNNPSTYRAIFCDEMRGGYGSRNKTINFLYELDKELIRSALRGMFEGDGAFRKRIDKRNSKPYFSLTYKTTSKKLAYELTHILNTIFDVKSSLYYGVSPVRTLEGRTLNELDYYKIDVYGNDNIDKLFPDIFVNDPDYHAVGTTKYSGNKNKDEIKIKEIIPVGVKSLVDITMEKSHLFTISHGVITHNCGGGEPTTHPDFIKLLATFHELGIVPNYTTNGMHMIQEIIDATKKYCGGVALSCHKHLEYYWSACAARLVGQGIRTNFHHVISDRDSIDYFVQIYDIWNDVIDYFVLLPYSSQGRGGECEVDWDYLVERVPKSSKIAFGANFYAQLLGGGHGINVSLYSPEIMSKFLNLKDMKIYGSSFAL